jgi:hypothetical protein
MESESLATSQHEHITHGTCSEMFTIRISTDLFCHVEYITLPESVKPPDVLSCMWYLHKYLSYLTTSKARTIFTKHNQPEDKVSSFKNEHTAWPTGSSFRAWGIYTAVYTHVTASYTRLSVSDNSHTKIQNVETKSSMESTVLYTKFRVRTSRIFSRSCFVSWCSYNFGQP